MANGNLALLWAPDPHFSASTAADRHVVAALQTQPLGEDDTLTGGQRPAWMPWARAQIERLGELQPGWDSYGGRPPSRRLLEQALRILAEVCGPRTPRPSITPMASGHVQLEWHVAGIDLEVEVVTPARLEVLFASPLTGEEWEGSLDYDLSVLTSYVARLASPGAA